MSTISEHLANLKTSTGVAAATMTAGLSEWLNVIPDNIGKLAVVMSIILTAVLIVVHLHKIKRERVETRHIELKNKQLERLLKEH